MRTMPPACLSAFLVLTATATAAGDEPQLLTDTGTLKQDLVFVDGGEALVFVELIAEDQLALTRLNMSDNSVERLHPDFTNNEFEPAFSPDGTHYAFLQNVGNLNLRLVVRNREDDTEAEFKQGGFSGMRSPCFTADGQRVIYAYPEQSRQHLFSCDLECGDRQQLTDSSGGNNWPSVPVDGSMIVFGSTRDGNFEVYRMAADGSNPRRLTDHPMQDIRPRVSPDGNQVVFTSNRDGNYELYLMQADGSRLSRLTQNSERDDFAAWHPDGRQIAYVREHAGRFDIAVLQIFEGLSPD